MGTPPIQQKARLLHKINQKVCILAQIFKVLRVTWFQSGIFTRIPSEKGNEQTSVDKLI